MPFCPKCRFEFRDDIKTCPECQVPVVDKLEDVETSDSDFTEVYMVSNRMEADVVANLMSENGIPYLFRDLGSFQVLPDFGRRAQLHLAVPASREGEVRRLLKEAREDGALTEQGRFL